jgi:hypothetical protein
MCTSVEISTRCVGCTLIEKMSLLHRCVFLSMTDNRAAKVRKKAGAATMSLDQVDDAPRSPHERLRRTSLLSGRLMEDEVATIGSDRSRPRRLLGQWSPIARLPGVNVGPETVGQCVRLLPSPSVTAALNCGNVRLGTVRLRRFRRLFAS